MSLTIPANALSETTSITVDLLGEEEFEELAGDQLPKSEVVAFLPHGLSFAVPVTVNLTYQSSADEAYLNAWSSFHTKMNTARTGCTPGAHDQCRHEGSITENDTCYTLGFAPDADGASQMISHYNQLMIDIADYREICGYEVPQCDEVPEFSSPSYCGTDGRCGKCAQCSDNPDPLSPCSGRPMVTCDESTDFGCHDTISGTAQITSQDNGQGGTDYYLRYNEDPLNYCEIMVLVHTDSDSAEDIPKFEFHSAGPGDELYLGPAQTGGDVLPIQNWYYKIAVAFYAIDADCDAQPKVACSDSSDSCATLRTSNFPDPGPDDEVFFFNQPWWNGSSWQYELLEADYQLSE